MTIDAHAAERVRFFTGQVLTADDFTDEQRYHRRRLREHNRFLHGWGVVCGLDVGATPSAGRPWQVTVSPGYAISAQGDPIHVTAPISLDLASGDLRSGDPCARARPGAPAGEDGIVHVAVRAIDCEVRPVPAPLGGDDAGREFSRIRDAHELTWLAELPETHAPGGPDAAPAPWSPCPSDPWVVIATVRLPATRSTEVRDVRPFEHRRTLPAPGR